MHLNYSVCINIALTLRTKQKIFCDNKYWQNNSGGHLQTILDTLF